VFIFGVYVFDCSVWLFVGVWCDLNGNLINLYLICVYKTVTINLCWLRLFNLYFVPFRSVMCCSVCCCIFGSDSNKANQCLVYVFKTIIIYFPHFVHNTFFLILFYLILFTPFVPIPISLPSPQIHRGHVCEGRRGSVLRSV
jgi:hypothetical protein